MPAKRKIGSLSGQLISKKLGRAKARAGESITLVELWNGKTLDASVNSNELRYSTIPATQILICEPWEIMLNFILCAASTLKKN